MSYHSPFVIFESIGISTEELFNSPSEKLEKRLLLELELSGKDFFAVGKQELSKNDILELFKKLKQENELSFHLKVFNNKPLLKFLESGEFENHTCFYDEDLSFQKDFEEFREFTSPLLIEPLRKRINVEFNKRNFKGTIKLLDLYNLLTPYDRMSVFDKLSGSVKQLNTILNQFSKKEIPLDMVNYRFITDDSFYTFINALPSEFGYYRERFAINLNNLGATYQRTNLEFVYKLFQALSKLKCGLSMKETIDSNKVIVTDSYLNKNDKVKSRRYGCLSFVSVIIILFVLVRAFSALLEDSESSYPFKEDFLTQADNQKYKLPALIQHKLLINRISGIQGQEINKNTKPYSELPDTPYAPYYKNIKNKSRKGTLVSVKNECNQEAIVFVISIDGNYSFSLSNDSINEFYIQDQEKISFYLGKNWRPDFSLKIKGLPEYSGILDEVQNAMYKKLNDAYSLKSRKKEYRYTILDSLYLDDEEGFETESESIESNQQVPFITLKSDTTNGFKVIHSGNILKGIF